MAEKRKDKDGRILPENVTQRKDGTYMWRKSVNGKNYCLYAKTLGEIKQKRNVALGEIEKGEFKGKHEKMREERELAKKDITLNEWFSRWEKVYRIGNIKESTLNNNHRQYMKYFSDNLGKMKLKEIRQIHVTDILSNMSKNGYCYSTISHCSQQLFLMFEAAMQNELINTNPAMGALKIKKERPPERRVLTDDEIEQFVGFVKNNSRFKHHEAFFVVGFNTGMRIGEILSLTWDDIDFDKKVIHVNKTLNHIKDYVKDGGKAHFAVTAPKTDASIRDVPMIKKVQEALELQKKMQTKSKVIIDGYTDFVFTTRTGNVFQPENIRTSIKRIIDKINENEKREAEEQGREPIIFERFSPHCMRHTFATRCYEKGVREKVVQKILGHSTLDMTLNVYTHTTDEMIADDVKKIDN